MPSRLSRTVPDEPNNPFEKIVSHYAERLAEAPGAARLARLARSARRAPEPLLDDVTALILQVDDVELVGADISLHLFDLAYSDAKCVGAVHFLAALRMRLQRYVDDPRAASAARSEFRERVGRWRMALGRAAELCRWPTIVLMKT
jgi:hypothetical protein